MSSCSEKTAHDVARANSRADRTRWAVVQSSIIADLFTAMPAADVPPGRTIVARYSSGRKVR